MVSISPIGWDDTAMLNRKLLVTEAYSPISSMNSCEKPLSFATLSTSSLS